MKRSVILTLFLLVLVYAFSEGLGNLVIVYEDNDLVISAVSTNLIFGVIPFSIPEYSQFVKEIEEPMILSPSILAWIEMFGAQPKETPKMIQERILIGASFVLDKSFNGVSLSVLPRNLDRIILLNENPIGEFRCLIAPNLAVKKTVGGKANENTEQAEIGKAENKKVKVEKETITGTVTVLTPISLGYYSAEKHDLILKVQGNESKSYISKNVASMSAVKFGLTLKPGRYEIDVVWGKCEKSYLLSLNTDHFSLVLAVE